MKIRKKIFSLLIPAALFILYACDLDYPAPKESAQVAYFRFFNIHTTKAVDARLVIDGDFSDGNKVISSGADFVVSHDFGQMDVLPGERPISGYSWGGKKYLSSLAVAPIINGFDMYKWEGLAPGAHRFTFFDGSDNRADRLADTTVTVEAGGIYTVILVNDNSIKFVRENFAAQELSDTSNIYICLRQFTPAPSYETYDVYYEHLVPVASENFLVTFQSEEGGQFVPIPIPSHWLHWNDSVAKADLDLPRITLHFYKEGESKANKNVPLFSLTPSHSDNIGQNFFTMYTIGHDPGIKRWARRTLYFNFFETNLQDGSPVQVLVYDLERKMYHDAPFDGE